MAMDQHDHSKPARQSDDGVQAEHEHHAHSESPRTFATVSVSIDLRGADADRVSGVISRIVAAVGETPSVTVEIKGPDEPAEPVTEVFDLRADEDDDPLAAFPAEDASRLSPEASLPPERPASVERRPAEIREETKFEWLTQPAAGPLVRRMAPDKANKKARQARPRLRAAGRRAWTSFSRGCQRVRERAKGAAVVVRRSTVMGDASRMVRQRAGTARQGMREIGRRSGEHVARLRATLGRVATQGVERMHGWRGRNMRGATGAGLAALVLVVALWAMLPMPGMHTGRAIGSAPPAAVMDPPRGEHRATAIGESADKRVDSAAVSPSRPLIAGPKNATAVALRPAQTHVERGRPEKQAAARAVSRQAVTAPRFVGGLSVWSTPQGASVAVNNRQVGTTPLRIRRLPIGTYAVRIDLDGFERWTRAVQVSSGSEVVVRPTLRREHAASDPVASRVSR